MAKAKSGAKFAALKNKVAKNYTKKGMSAKKANAIGAAVAAKVGVKSMGQAKMTKLAVAGKKVKENLKNTKEEKKESPAIKKAEKKSGMEKPTPNYSAMSNKQMNAHINRVIKNRTKK